jgi:hypothetical protein
MLVAAEHQVRQKVARSHLDAPHSLYLPESEVKTLWRTLENGQNASDFGTADQLVG